VRQSVITLLLHIDFKYELSSSSSSGTAMTWKTKKQDVVALSTTEAEYMALSEAAKAAAWMRNLYTELGIPVDKPTTIYEDNISTMILAEHGSQHPRTKHIQIRFHRIRDYIKDKEIILEHLETKEMLGDLFTKPLVGPQFEKLREGCGLVDDLSRKGVGIGSK